jgi:RNA polymerase sigma-70 factor (ECF subfamily)
MLDQHEDAEDAIQITFLKLYRGINKFRYNSKFSSYLFRILINVCHDLMHTRKRHKTEDLALVTKSSEQPDEIQVNLEKSIQKLPERMRECFILYAIEDFSQSDIAQMMQLSVGTVKAHIFQAKQKLRAWLFDDPEEVAHEL